MISAFARQVSLADAPSGSGRHRGDAANFGRVGLFDADASANAAFGTSSADAPLPVPVDMYWTDPNWPLLVDDALASIAYSMRREPALDTSDVFFPNSCPPASSAWTGHIKPGSGLSRITPH